MGIPISLDIRNPFPDPTQTEAVVKQAYAVLRDADQRFSTYRADSEVSRIRSGKLRVREASSDLQEVLAVGAAFQASSGGAFHCYTPAGEMDLNGVVKGWAVQRAADVMVAAGLDSFCINAGGDVVVRGRPGEGQRWHVGVRSPTNPARRLAVLAAYDEAVATSGLYERGPHIWDGRTGRPATALASVTVVAADLTTADILATTVFALGPDGVPWAAERYDCSLLALTAAGDILTGGRLASVLARP